MIPKSERDKDRAICEAAMGPFVVSDDCRSHDEDDTWTVAEVPVDAGNKRSLYVRAPRSTADETAACDIANALANGASRLPSYIAALDEIDARISDVERRAEQAEAISREARSHGDTRTQQSARDIAIELRTVIAILRGEQ